MLQQFSWGHFLTAVVVLNLVWYVFVGPVFYRAEVLAFLGVGEASGIVTRGVGSAGEAHLSGNVKEGHDDAIEREVMRR